MTAIVALASGSSSVPREYVATVMDGSSLLTIVAAVFMFSNPTADSFTNSDHEAPQTRDISQGHTSVL